MNNNSFMCFFLTLILLTSLGSVPTYAHLSDRQGSVIAVTNQATGTLAARYKYDAFGAREYDPEAELYHYRARTYDPNVGRFLQSDPSRWI